MMYILGGGLNLGPSFQVFEIFKFINTGTVRASGRSNDIVYTLYGYQRRIVCLTLIMF